MTAQTKYKLRIGGLVLATVVCLAAPVVAQDLPATGDSAGEDTIGALLDGPSPNAPPVAAPQSADAQRPVFVDEVGRTPDGPPTATDRNYEARLRSSFASAQGLQGPLDGRWTMSAAESDLYDLQLVDAGGSNLEGAWRDIHRPGAVEASGFLSQIGRSGSTLTFQFQPKPGAGALTATLSPSSDGRWIGELSDGVARRPVAMRRH